MADCDTEVSSTTDVVAPPAATNTLIPHDNEAIAQAIDSITGQSNSGSQDASHVLSLAAASTDAVDALVGAQDMDTDEQSVVSMATEADVMSSLGSNGGTMAVLNAVDIAGQASQDQVILTAADQTIADSVTDNHTLQSLLAGGQGGGAQLATLNGDTIQIIAMSDVADLANASGKIWHVLPSANSAEIATLIAVNQGDTENQTADTNLEQTVQMSQESGVSSTATQVVDMVPVSSMPDGIASILMPPPPQPQQSLPPGCPSWAARLRDCEKIGDAYRGWVESEVELDLLLTYHKQQTQSFWGTRQSPSPAKQSTRLMWKSQYVPFDGVPFINSGSRAIVMECQYGPRRKGSQVKRQGENLVKTQFKQTCPARIYIKKVRKFPEYQVDMTLDKKTMKAAMEKAFQLLKDRGTDGPYGQERHYVQLPTDKAHEFHQEMEATQIIPEPDPPHRLHPRVAHKIRDMVSSGETRLYVIRKALRRFVERELFENAEAVPEKHNLTYYPTVNDLQNHIHQAIKDIETGSLPVSAAHMVNVEVVPDGEESGDLSGGMWASIAGQNEQPHAETVTVTLTQNPGEDGSHVISRVETHMSDGTTQISNSLTTETAALLSKLHPNMFPLGSLVQLQDSESPSDSQTTSLTMQSTSPLTSDSEENQQVAALSGKADELQAEASLLAEPTATAMSDMTEPMTALQIVQQAAAAEGTQIDASTFTQGVQIIQDAQGRVQIVQGNGSTEIPEDAQFIQTASGGIHVIHPDSGSLVLDEDLTGVKDETLHMTSESEHNESDDMITIVTGEGHMVLKYDNTEPDIKTEMEEAMQSLQTDS